MYEEEEDEDYMNDIISLNYVHIKTEPVIDLVTSSDDEPEDDKSQIGISWYGNRSFVLPITFFDVSSNVEFLKECRPLSVKVVDCDKHPTYYEKLLQPKRTISAPNCPILPQTAKRENGKTNEATAKKLTEIRHPSHHENLLRPKTTISTANCPILPQTAERENDETDEASAKKSTEIRHIEMNVTTESKKLKTAITKVLTPVPNYSQSKNEIDQRKTQVSPTSNTLISNSQRETQKVFKNKDLTQFDSKRKQDLLGLVVGKQDQENAAHGHKHHSVDEKSSNETAKKDLIEDVGTALRNKFEGMIVGLTENKIMDFSEKRSNIAIIHEEKEHSKKNDVSNRNEQSNDGSPTRCSIKMTSSKVFEKAIKLKKTHDKKAKDKANSELNMSLVSKKTKTKDQTVPKLSLKRKNSEHKEFYVIYPTKEKSKSQCLNKKSKLSEETQGRLISKCKHVKATNETQRNPTEPDPKIASFVKDSPSPSILTDSPSPRRSEKHRKSVIVTPSNDTASNIKSYRNDCDLGKDTTSTQIANKAVSSVCLKNKIKNQTKCKPVVQKNNEKVVKSKNHINCLNPTSSDAKFSAYKSIENDSVLSGHVSQYSVVANNISNENIRPNQYVILQKTPPAGFKSTIESIINKALDKSMNYQVQSNVCVQKPIEPVESVANSNIPNIPQTGKTTSLNKGLRFPLMKQSGLKPDMINRTEPYMAYPERQINAPHNLYSTYNNVPNPNTASGTVNDSNSPSNLQIPKNIIIRHPNNLGHQFSSAKDANIFYVKKTPPPSYKEIGDGVKRPQEKEMQQMLQSTQPHPAATANDHSNFARPVYSRSPVNKTFILKGSPARHQPNIPPHYSNPIPTVVNHNLYHPRLPAVRPVRFASPWPPPNTNVAHIGPPFNIQYNNPHCRMPFVNTTFPGHSMCTEHWRQPMNGNHRNHFTYLPPRPPPPPPTVPVQRTVTHSLPVEPPAPTGTVIGSTAEGQLIKKITIAALPLTESPVVHEKEKMLAELNSAVEELEAASEKLVKKINKDPESDKMNVVPNAKKTVSSKPCPLSKKKNTNSIQNKVNNEVAEKAIAVQGTEAKGYSPPILPIPSYQQAFEILAKNEQKKTDIMKKMETINANKEVIIRPMKKRTNEDSKNKHINSKPAKNQYDKGPKSKPADGKPTKTKLPEPGKRKYEKTKKISLEEYKQKLTNNNVTVRESSSSKCKKRKKQKGLPVDQDLGYDSDATLVL